MEEEKQRKSQKKRIIKIAVLSLLAGLCIWYIAWCNIPVSRQFTGTFWSENGEKIEVDFDLTWQRYACLPSELEGRVTIHGITYVSRSFYKSKPFFEKLWMKLTGENYSDYLFLNPSNDPMRWMDTYVRLCVEERDKKFEEIELWVRYENSSHLVIYYGPAETFEEARRIYFQKRGLTH